MTAFTRAHLVLFAASAALAFAITASAPQQALAQGACAATGIVGGSVWQAQAGQFPASYHTGCTGGMVSGDATSCARLTNSAAWANFFIAKWASTSARTMDTTGGCVFVCNTGTCRVGNDGLPVELLRFGVE